MSLVSNVRVYGLPESIFASGYAMREEPPTEAEFQAGVELIDLDLLRVNPAKDNSNIRRSQNLANTPIGSGHDQYETGIIVQFDVNFTIKAWTEAERYTFLNFVTSMSTMHRISKIVTQSDKVFSEYTDPRIIEIIHEKTEIYNQTKDPEDYLRLLYSCPVGLKLTARLSTNYRQLRTIYHQRKDHRLPEWREFCRWIESIPFAEQYIIGKSWDKI